MRSNDRLVDEVEDRAPSYLGGRRRSPRVISAMRLVDRGLFLPGLAPVEAYRDEAAPIGRGQTCSQPSMVAFMLDLLEIDGGQRILEIGAGSGYAAAVASVLCAPGGIVYACEIVGSLAMAMKGNLTRWRESLASAGESRPPADIAIIAGDGSAGFPDLPPFDRIFLSAGVSPGAESGFFREAALLDRLGERGLLLYPETRGALRLVRKRGRTLERESWYGVAFVPLIHHAGTGQ